MQHPHRTRRRRLVGAAAIVGVLLVAGRFATGTAAAIRGTVPPEHQVNRGRIEFAPGASSGQVSGTVAAGDWQHWVAWAAAGQMMEGSVSGNATFEVYSPSGALLADDLDSFTTTLSASGDYVIDVGSTGGVANYTLTLTITGEPASPAPPPAQRGGDRVEFPRGTFGTTVAGDIEPATFDRWVLWAAAGQTMSLSLTSVTGNITFEVSAPDGTRITGGTSTSSSVVLPGGRRSFPSDVAPRQRTAWENGDLAGGEAAPCSATMTAMLLTEIDHVAIAVRDLEAAIEYYHRAFGATVDHREVVASDGVEEALLKVAESYVQLLTPTRDDSPVARAIDKRGEGLHHIGYRVTDCAAALEAMRAAGANPIDQAPRPGSRGTTVAFIHPKGSFGTLIELVQEN